MMSPPRSNASVREPAVAGFFYPGDAAELSATVDALLDAAPVVDVPTTVSTPANTLAMSRANTPATRRANTPATSRANIFIVPHAGYVYSGGVAAAAYALIRRAAQPLHRVIVIGPSHRVYLRGIAIPQVDAFRTPLGVIRIDAQRKRALVRRGDVILSDAPHELEHSLEVQLPFLQRLSQEIEILPLVVGEATPEHVASVLDDVFDAADTVLLASSDLSHYLQYEQAQQQDATTSARILAFANDLSGEQACGAVALNGVLEFAKRRHASITELARLNSGDTAGDRSRVVGYGAYAIYDDRRSQSQ